MTCPELDVLQARGWTPDLTAHVGACGSCRLVMELIDERSQAAESRERRGECARFEVLIAVRAGGELHGAGAKLLDEHLRDCDDCRALADTIAPANHAAPDHTTLPAIDGNVYALGPEVARGGMGRIVAARDLRIGRPVAVKELLARTATQATRFEREARVTARLQHPGIVPIYEIGRWESGTPFYAMRMVKGRTLRSAIAACKTLDERLALLPRVIAASEAVAFAHANQVIHRDLTPANIMVGDHGETVVIDWGLAKDLAERDDDLDAGPYRQDPAASAELTAAGSVIGTAAYMPPEQAAGQRVDARADVYALGAILYHLLAGYAPYRGGSDEVLRAVRAGPPPRLPASTPHDLVSIVTKAMARDPSDRYPSAEVLAAELTAFQAGRLVGAHEYTRGELIRRWVRKRRGVLAVTSIALVGLAIFGALAVARIGDERDRAEGERAVAEARRAQSQMLSTTLLVEQGRQEALAGRTERAAALLAEALRADPTDRVTRQLLGPVMRTLEARERLQPPSLDADAVDPGARIWASLDGSRYLVRQRDKGIWVSESRPGAPIVHLADQGDAEWPQFSPDGRWIAGVSHVTPVSSTTSATLRLWSAKTGKIAWSVVVDRPLSWAGFSRDGTLVIAIATDGSWGTWAVASGDRESLVEAIDKGMDARPAAGVTSGIVEELLPIATADGRVSVWDWRRRVRITRFEHGGALGTPFSTAADPTTIITCGIDGRIKRWDARTGKLLGTLVEATGPVATCALASTGHVASCTPSGTIRVWSPSGLATASFDDDPSVLWFSADGTRLLQQSMERSVHLRDTATGTVIAQLGPSAIVGPPGERLFFARPDGAVDTTPLRVGIVRELARPTLPRPKESDRDVRVVLLPASGGGASLLDVATRHSVPLPVASPIAIAADGRQLVGWTPQGLAITSPSGVIQKVIPTAAAPTRLRISDDATRVAAKFADGRVIVWDVRTSNVIGTLEDDRHDLVFFDPAGRVGLWTQPGPFALWDPTQPRPIPITYRLFVIDSAEDGSLLAVSDGDVVAIHDAATGARKLLVQGGSPTFDRAGHVAIRNGDEVSIWSTTSWTRTSNFAISSPVSAAAIAASPDGSLIATSTGIWETERGRQLALFAHRDISVTKAGGDFQTRLDSVRFSRDGTELIVETESGLRVWDVRPESRSADEVVAIIAARQPWRVIDGQLVLPKPERRASAVLSIRGRAIRGAAVVGAPVFDPWGQVGVTGPDGVFEVFRAAGRHLVTIGDSSVGAFGRAELTASEHPTTIDIPLTFEASVAGRVIDRSGRPRAGILVSLHHPTDPDVGQATTALDGTFQIRALQGSLTYDVRLVDTATGSPVASPRPLPRPTLATASTHLENFELVVEDAPPLPKEISPTVYFRLTTRWQPTRSLDIAYPTGHLVFWATGAFVGQLWRFTPVGDAWRLSTQSQGETKRLGIRGDDVSLVEHGSQTWTFEAVAGAYRVRLVGDPRCLAGGLRLALVDCADTPDQQWLVTPTTARVPHVSP